MLLTQFRFENLANEEKELLPEFFKQLKKILMNEITPTVKLKIAIRVPYLYKVNWILWKTKKIEVDDIINAIYKAIKIYSTQDNIYKVVIDENATIPNTYSPLNRLVRFLEYGDINYKGLGLFTRIEHLYNYKKLNGIWRAVVMQEYGDIFSSRIIGAK